ncbi:SCO3374 family protein [Streptomyces sp. TRM64462]|uniref:SCO3374 family protein n=1 Tax=Streptomyces sp. TRM64462 TaxID=2741726 RepID=UPI001586678B|nr:SCO3374 family protein [Streptomyces sp. TRM64462]
MSPRTVPSPAVHSPVLPPVAVPAPRPPLDGPASDRVARWYEDELGWATASASPAGSPARSPAERPAGAPVRLLTGLRFDVLELPAAAGFAVLRRVGGEWPVALAGHRMRMLVAAGSAEELPGLLDWLEWSGVGLDLAACGTGGRITAPTPPGWGGSGTPGAAVWLRPPVPGREVEPTLPGMSALPGLSALPGPQDVPGSPGGGPEGPGLVRLVAVAAAECHRVRLLAARVRRQEGADQRLASS